MDFTIIQVIIIAFALFAWTRAMLRLKDNLVTGIEFVFWSIIWVGVIIVSLIPGILLGVANLIGIASGISMLVYIGIMGLFYLVFRLYVKLEDQEQKLTKLIRELSINNNNKNIGNSINNKLAVKRKR